jgi:hypothetical protein
MPGAAVTRSMTPAEWKQLADYIEVPVTRLAEMFNFPSEAGQAWAEGTLDIPQILTVDAAYRFWNVFTRPDKFLEGDTQDPLSLLKATLLLTATIINWLLPPEEIDDMHRKKPKVIQDVTAELAARMTEGILAAHNRRIPKGGRKKIAPGS